MVQGCSRQPLKFDEMFAVVNIFLCLCEQVQEFEGKETALLIDRYKYLDLLPCSDSELKAIGYMVCIDTQFQDMHMYLRKIPGS